MMEDGESDDDGTFTNSDSFMERIILHVYDDESKEFSSLTTYHGMSGMMLFFYQSHPTFFKTTDSLLTEEHLPAVTLCKLGGADRWRKYPVIKSKSELLSSFDAAILGESLDFNDIVNLQRLEDMFMNTTGEGFNVRQFLEESRVRCEDFVKSVRVADRQLRSHCGKAKWSLTDYGYCTTFSLWNTSVAHSISIDVKTLLDTGNWGDCTRGGGSIVSSYDRADCERDCIVEQFIRRCGCAPFFAESSYVRTCSLVEMGICGRQVECERLDYSNAMVSYRKKNRQSYSTIEIFVRSRRLQTDQQMKRIKAVDLLSYVAGSMGLFLGMSCVTLLEIFIYLFKSVWGVFNDQRHKSYYLDNFLGDDENNDETSDEEIFIITKTRRSTDKASAVVEDHESNDVSEETLERINTSGAPVVGQSIVFDRVNQEPSGPTQHDHHSSRVKIQIVHHPFERRRSSFAIQ
ncbi:unnamed protein product [Haemonchus placei]|uniref:Amiloride-sensitive sodium channel n=1 Tax=Haemonchus placei TaxID=6290 RepID=A0A158QL18_HAEPC|nr:unnamed protein product [Haemonchus placei]